MGAESGRRTGRWAARVPYGRLVLAGIGVGVVVFGLGSRVAMRAVGLAASPAHLGEPTEFGIVGRVTVGGVLTLVIIGAIGGLLAGLLYLAVRSWLPGGWVARGVVFCLLLLSPIGALIVATSRSDFDLVSQALIFVLFAGMILIEGLATAWAIERLGRHTLAPPRPRPIGYVVLGTVGSLGVFALGNALSDLS
jgi:hypothetical protein